MFSMDIFLEVHCSKKTRRLSNTHPGGHATTSGVALPKTFIRDSSAPQTFTATGMLSGKSAARDRGTVREFGSTCCARTLFVRNPRPALIPAPRLFGFRRAESQAFSRFAISKSVERFDDDHGAMYRSTYLRRFGICHRHIARGRSFIVDVSSSCCSFCRISDVLGEGVPHILSRTLARYSRAEKA